MKTDISSPGNRGLVFREDILLEQSVKGRTGISLPKLDVEDISHEDILPSWAVRKRAPFLPEVSEPQVVRHFTRLSQWNFSIDSGMYPLGSCTMKYNPKINEVAARLRGFSSLHPEVPVHLCQSNLELMYDLERYLSEITGLESVSLQPSAGAQGEFAGVLIIRAYHQNVHSNPRKKILIPESAHGTNPASCAIAGYQVVTVKSGEGGILYPEQVEALMDEDVAALMMTNPNTLGLFETNIGEIAEVVHKKGGLLYMDGANMNAITGKARPGDMGVDVMHLNLHKTFSTPHGGGGPGSGPIAVRSDLAKYLPVPRIIKKFVEGKGNFFELEQSNPLSIGRLRSFFGNFGMLVRAYTYIRTLGPKGLLQMSEMAVLNANYIKEQLKNTYYIPYDKICMHEVVFTDKEQNAYGIKTLDIAKRLMDYGFHPPTVYFPLVVSGALMIEPTESETKDSLDQFIYAMRQIAKESEESPEVLKNAPHKPVCRRLDETLAARKPVLRWKPDFMR